MNLKILLLIAFSMLILLLLAVAPTENSRHNNTSSLQTEDSLKENDETFVNVIHFNEIITNSSHHNQFNNLSGRLLSNCKDFTDEEKPADKKFCIKKHISKLMFL